MRYMVVCKLMISIFLLLSCGNNSKKNDYRRVISDNYFFEYSRNSSFITRERFILYKTYKNENVNEYHLEKNNGKIELIRSVTSDTLELKNVIPKVKSIIKTNRKYGVLGYTHDFSKNGIDTKYYLIDGAVILYVPNDKIVKNEYAHYLKKCVNVKKRWYYSPEDW